MTMKKQAMIAVIVTGLALTGIQQATARGWGGGYNGRCPENCNWNVSNQLDEATKEKIAAFRADTLDLRKKMAMKRAEKRALMMGDSPNPAAVAQVEGELFDLRTTLQTKAVEAGVPFLGAMKNRGGYGGSGKGYGPCGRKARWN